MTNSKHNKYVSTPDWFTAHPDVYEKPVETKVVQAVIGGGGGSGVSDVKIYNKFALENKELDKDELTFIGQAIVAIAYDEVNVGDLVDDDARDSTDYILIAANTQMTIDCTKHANYGIVFYDYSLKVVRAISFEETTSFPTELTVPDGSYYFRISCLNAYDNFKIEYSSPKPYTIEQLEITRLNTADFTQINNSIPDGFVSEEFSPSVLSFLVENPLYLHVDTKGVLRISLNYAEMPGADVGNMFVWDKKYAAFGFDPLTETAYSYTDGVQDFELDEEGNPALDEEGKPIPIIVANRDKWLYDDNATDKWIIKSTRQKLSLLDGLMEYDVDKDSFLFHKNIITTGGVTQYADLGDVDIPDLYDGLSLDNTTITWVYDSEGKNKVLTAISNLDVDNKFVTREEWNAFLGVENDSDRLINTWSELVAFLNNMEEGTNLLEFFDNYAHKRKDEPIEGIYNFLKGLRINSKYLQYDAEKNVWKFEGNIAATGGITMYYNDQLEPDPNLLDQIIVSPPLYKEDGMLKIDVESISGGISNIVNGAIGAKQFVTGLDLSEDGETITVNKRMLTQIDIPDLSELYVNRTTDQTVSGWKDFLTGIKFNNLSMYHLKDNTVYLDANLAVKGGVTMYADIDTDVESILNAIPLAGYDQKGLASFDNKWFVVDGGHVTFLDPYKDGVGLVKNPLKITAGNQLYQFDGSSLVIIPMDNIYLQLAGGTMSGTINSQIVQPRLDSTYTLGSESNYWSNLYTRRMNLDGIDVYQSKEDVMFIDANLVVRGGVTMYGSDSTDIPNILDSIPVAGYGTPGLAAFNSEHFSISNGVVSLIKPDRNALDFKLNIDVNGSKYQYDGSSEISIPINYTTLGLNNHYVRLDNVSPPLEKAGYHRILTAGTVSEAENGDLNTLYIIL